MQVNVPESEISAQMFAVDPKKDCPHAKASDIQETLDRIEELLREFARQNCKNCENVGENWVCLECRGVFCSRYVNQHMLAHNQESAHKVGLSVSDGSYWCFVCDTYVTNQALDKLRHAFALAKFAQSDEEVLRHFKKSNKKDVEQFLVPQSAAGGGNPNDDEERKAEDGGDHDQEDPLAKAERVIQQMLVKKMQNLLIEEGDFTRQELVAKVKSGAFKKVVFMVGAGISVSAGIPDFRTPGTGIYSQLEKYNLPYPEAIFTLEYFKKNPMPFYVFSREFKLSGCQPTINHVFINEFNKRGFLMQCMTQNIDGLELDAGLTEDKVMQAHGHYRTAHCTKCRAEADIAVFNKCVEDGTIHKCGKNSCEGLVKPDIVFFGEALPNDFFNKAEMVGECDLAIVMGTSLKVAPFSLLLHEVPQETPVVLINRENPGVIRSNFLFLEGDLDDQVEALMKDFGWEVPQIQRKKPSSVNFDTIKESEKSTNDSSASDSDKKSKL